MTLLPQPIPDDPVEGALGHFEHSNWVKASVIALDAALTKPLGGLFSLDIVLDPPAGEDANIYLRGAGDRSLWSQNAAGVPRWRLMLGDSTAESGADSGAMFKLRSFTDTGVAKDTVLEGDRSNGLLKVKGAPTADTGIATKKYVDDSMPIGAIIAYGGSTAPAGWHLCNGSAHGSAALQALIGSANTPDLSGRFIVGAGSGYNPKATGGAATVTLTAAQSGLVGHGHAAGASNNNVDHSHSGATGSMNRNWSHGHGMGAAGAFQQQGYLSDYIRNGDDPPGTAYGILSQTTKQMTPVPTPAHTHPIYNADTNHEHGFTTGGQSTAHTHSISVTAAAAANAAQSHENRPPYYALVYIIKKV
jgi:microcystin-dependent protein